MDDVTNKSHGAVLSELGQPAIERWLVEAVVPVFDAMQADPTRGIPASDETAALDALHAQWLKNDERGA